MDWLSIINTNTAVLVPTRGLQHSLSKRYAEQQMAAGQTAWQTPTIIVWEDYIEQLWRANKHHFDQAYLRLDTAQAFIVWQQIITAAKRDTAELVLLNEQQTAKVAQRSWKLAHKWRVDPQATPLREDLDSKAFAQWCQSYVNKLREKHWLDTAQVETLLVDHTESLKGLPEHIVFAYFDLLSSNQKAHLMACEQQGITVTCKAMVDEQSDATQHISYHTYQQPEQEWRTVLERARELIEQDPKVRIGIIVPDLSEKLAQFEQMTRAIFYPELSPLQCQQQDLVYRFSLGQPLNTIPYVHAMLGALALLKKTFSYQQLHTFLMSEWWPFRQQSTAENAHIEQLIDLERAIKKRRSAWLSWHDVLTISQEELPTATALHAFFEQLIEFQLSMLELGVDPERAQPNLQPSRYWHDIFSQWLYLLGWSENDLDSWHYQAHESWLEVLETFLGHDVVQGPIGLSRALRALESLCKDKVYLRQAKDEPLLISGVLEGIGQAADYLFITGMHEAYPPPMPQDPFIANSALSEQSYPFADQQAAFAYEQNKLASLMAGGKQVSISYAVQQAEGEFSPTTLLRDHEFTPTIIETYDVENPTLESYIDTVGVECLQSAQIQGGSKVFENQSQCPFKAYVEHRLLRRQDEEPEFGLDARDAGSLIHELLAIIWQELQSFSSLSRLSETELIALVERHVETFIAKPNPQFQFDRQRLLALEKPRLKRLLIEWLTLEQEQRYLPYSVIGLEQSMLSEFGGIPIKLVIDRIDQTDSGDCLIIDYKTGQAELSDWQGERPKSPQMPLYALALEQRSNYTIKGIAFGRLKTDDCALKGVTELAGVGQGFRENLSVRDKKTWSEQLQEWHTNLTALADEFLAGHAVVNPSRANPCQFCDLHSVCRIHQLQRQSGQSSDQSGGQL